MTSDTKFKLAIAYWIGYIVFMCLFTYFSHADDYKNSEKAEATVIDALWGAGRNKYGKEIGYYAQFEFRYNDSTYISADKSIAGREKRAGSKLTVIFPKGQPGEAKIYTFFSYWFTLRHWLASFMVAFFVFFIPILIGQYTAFKREYRHTFNKRKPQ